MGSKDRRKGGGGMRTRAPKKSEAITVEPFEVSASWVSVKIHANHIWVKRLSMVPLGLVWAASNAVHQLAISVWMNNRDGHSSTDQLKRAICSAPDGPRMLLFMGHAPGQKLLPVELRMEKRKWEKVCAASAALGVSVATFCQEALHQRSMRLADFQRENEHGRELAV